MLLLQSQLDSFCHPRNYSSASDRSCFYETISLSETFMKLFLLVKLLWNYSFKCKMQIWIACDRIFTQFKKVEVEKIVKSAKILHCEPRPDSSLQINDLWKTSLFFLPGGTDGAVLQYTGVKCGKQCSWVKFDQLIVIYLSSGMNHPWTRLSKRRTVTKVRWWWHRDKCIKMECVKWSNDWALTTNRIF